MANPTEWKEVDGHYELGDARAERFDDVPVFVIRTFGRGADAESAFNCIRAAMPHGQIAIDGAEENRVIARLLVDNDSVKFAPFVGLPFDAFGVAAVKG
ncbi:hypothetical protein [Roseiconus lacunae]|uniref:hypothetical protein n=1 Tax=Roseiconus lacunae TaxID=2605694 RepID=UPI001E5E1637|nr:hypothetical protein [Roseiconus lacunae]MCD0460076.1 hypothetical protein [Roseiconus lacunae]